MLGLEPLETNLTHENVHSKGKRLLNSAAPANDFVPPCYEYEFVLEEKAVWMKAQPATRSAIVEQKFGMSPEKAHTTTGAIAWANVLVHGLKNADRSGDRGSMHAHVHIM